MPELAVDPSKFAGMSEEQARTFPRRKLIGEDLTPEQVDSDAEDDFDRLPRDGAG